MFKPAISICLAFLFCLGTSLLAQNSEFHSKRLLVSLADDVDVNWYQKNYVVFTDPSINMELAQIGAKTLKPLLRRDYSKNSKGLHADPMLLEFNHDFASENTVELLRKLKCFDIIEFDYVSKAHGVCKVSRNDKHNNRQWSYRNDGTFNSQSVAGADIDLDLAWTIEEGDSVVVISTLDSGLKLDHPEFSGRIWKNKNENPLNSIDDDGNGFMNDIVGWDFVNNDNDPTDDHGHGTNVTGIIGAIGNNNIGYAGVTQNCKLMTCQVLDTAGRGFYSWWISAIYYSVDNGADIINMSLGGTASSLSMTNAVNYALVNNVLIVASMGNRNNAVLEYPAAIPGVFAVGATDVDYSRASPFSWGSGSSFGRHINVSAPGNRIYGLNHLSDTAYGWYWSGTSQAAPHVSGLAALLKSVDTSFTVNEIIDFIQAGAMDQLGRSNEDIAGFDDHHGWGIINAFNSLLMATAKEKLVCPGIVSRSGNQIWDQEKLYRDTIFNPNGCDTVYMVDIKFPKKYDSLTIEACEPTLSPSGKFVWSIPGKYSDTLKNYLGCDSIIIVDFKFDSYLEKMVVKQCGSYTLPSNSRMVTNSGIYLDTLKSSFGCDSVLEIDFTNQISNVKLVDSSCSDYISPSGKYSWITTGTYFDTLSNSYGCDSIIEVELSVYDINETISRTENKIEAIIRGGYKYQWVSCNGLNINGENSNQFELSGSFPEAKLKINYNHCQFVSECFEYEAPASNSYHESYSGYSVYPSPTHDYITITFESGNYNALIINGVGEIMKEFKGGLSEVIDVSDFNAGVYVILVLSENRQPIYLSFLKY